MADQHETATDPSASPEGLSDLRGRSFGAYQVDALIGSGGMASVYRAHKRGVAGATKQVALKVIHPHLVSKQTFLQMFKDEMRVATALSHRNIVQTFDVGQSGAYYYIVMELVRGCSLSELLVHRAPQPLPLDVALFLAMEVCSGLEHAHTLRPSHPDQPTGVVHRDISPGNILTSVDGDVKLVDFGIAKASGRLGLSHAGEIKGKAGFIAPEQIFGQADARSDLFSLGAVLFEMLGGGKLREGADWNAILAAADHQQLPPTRPLSDLPEGLPARLVQLIGRCVATDPAERPKSAAALRQELAAELFAAQKQYGRRDLHQAMGALVAEVMPPPKETATEGHADRLAAALLAEAEGLSMDHGFADSASQAATVPDRPTPAAREPRRFSWRVRLGALVALCAAAYALWSMRPHDDASPSPVVKADAAPPTIAKGPSADATPAMPMTDKGPTPATRPALAVEQQPRRKRRFGQLDINSLPWAKVYVDGRYRGDTPLQKLRVSAGAHRLRLFNPEQKLGYKTRLRVGAGQRVKRFYRLSKAK